MIPPLPVSPHDPAFQALIVQEHLSWLSEERARFRRAQQLPEWRRGDAPCRDVSAAWAALKLWPLTRAEIAARLDELDSLAPPSSFTLAALMVNAPSREGAGR